MGNVRSANGNARRKAVAWLRAQQRPCWICEAFGRQATIDYSLPPGHPGSFECDELVPVSRGGSPYAHDNIAAAHRACNQWRSNRSVSEVMRMASSRGASQARVARSRRWI